MESIKLNDLLQLSEEQLENTKIRFMVPNDLLTLTRIWMRKM